MNRRTFTHLVAGTIDSLPPLFKERLSNVEVVVEDWPDPETMRLAGVKSPAQLLGFYHGVPLTQRTHDYGAVLPDRISIYRLPILSVCVNRREVQAAVRRTLQHEIAHHFGIGDERLREIGAY